MSQLSRLIEQARKTRNVNDMFKFQPAAAVPQQGQPPVDVLLMRLTELEASLFDASSVTEFSVEDLAGELESIARTL